MRFKYHINIFVFGFCIWWSFVILCICICVCVWAFSLIAKNCYMCESKTKMYFEFLCNIYICIQICILVYLTAFAFVFVFAFLPAITVKRRPMALRHMWRKSILKLFFLHNHLHSSNLCLYLFCICIWTCIMPEPTPCGVDQWQGRIVTGTYQREENGHVPTIREENAEIKRKNPVKLSYFNTFSASCCFSTFSRNQTPGSEEDFIPFTSPSWKKYKVECWNCLRPFWHEMWLWKVSTCEKQATVGLWTGVRSRSEKWEWIHFHFYSRREKWNVLAFALFREVHSEKILISLFEKEVKVKRKWLEIEKWDFSINLKKRPCIIDIFLFKWV